MFVRVAAAKVNELARRESQALFWRTAGGAEVEPGNHRVVLDGTPDQPASFQAPDHRVTSST